MFQLIIIPDQRVSMDNTISIDKYSLKHPRFHIHRENLYLAESSIYSEKMIKKERVTI